MERMIIGVILWLSMAPVAAGAAPLSLETGVSYPQQDNRPCVFGNPYCHNPTGFDFTLIPVNTSAGTLASPVYTLDQIRSAVGDRLEVGVDVNDAQLVYSLQSFELNINGGSPEYTFTGPADIPAVNKGKGFSDARLMSFDISGLTGTGVWRRRGSPAEGPR